MSCIAVRYFTSGPCKHAVFKDGRCSLHYNGMVSTGAKHVIENELTLSHKNERAALHMKYRGVYDHRKLEEELEVVDVHFKYKRMDMERMLSTTPDTPADIKYRREVERRKMQREHKQQLREAQRQAEAERQRQQLWLQELDDPPQREDLIGFAADRQNVHRAVTVNEVVKKTIQKVILIPVPAEYRWNMETVSKTPGEIIAECKISIAAGKLLVEKYTSDETIYDMVSGIYGKTLDSVWQYIKSSSDKEVLIKTLKIELEDNIDMCAQGNLTRLCNVLQGYVTDMPAPPVAEILGDLLPPLMSIEDLTVRYEKALQILRTYNVPDAEHAVWIEPLLD